MALPRLSRFARPVADVPPPFSGDADGGRLFHLLPRRSRRLFAALDGAEGCHAELLEDLRDLPEISLACEDWLAASRLLVGQGRFRLGGAFREQAVRRALSDASSPAADQAVLTTGFCAALDQARFGEARTLLSRLESARNVGRVTVTRMRGYLELLSGNRAGFRECCQGPADASEGAFAESIGGKSIAMVGPAAGEARQGGEIDGFDRVARSNHRGNDTTYDPSGAGSRTDLSFYQRRQLADLVDAGGTDRFFDWLRTIDWAVFKSLEFDFQHDAIRTGKAIVRRWNQLYFHGHPNLVPSNLYTLIHHRAGRIKVFNSNFFLSATPYARGYKEKARGLGDTFRTMASHDLISQVNFVRCLGEAGWVELDEECAAVVALSSRDYLAGLERVYTTRTQPESRPCT